MTAYDETERAYKGAQSRYGELGVNVGRALDSLRGLAISIPCWQGDDVVGFEGGTAACGGGILATGNFPGRARTADELRQDAEEAFKLIPGRHRFNLHAIYAETGGKKVERDGIETSHFEGWIDWAKEHSLGLDFNPTCFAHPLADSGFTLSHRDHAIRKFWIDHCRASRRIGAHMGRELGTACVTNIWVPDGYKDTPIDRMTPRALLAESLDAVLEEEFAKDVLIDSVESKLFGLGSESYVTGSYDFYLGYAVQRGCWLCLDTGHFHPTELVSDKLSSVLLHVKGVLLHLSRGVRWDSDHVVTLSDEVVSIAQEIVRNDALNRVRIGLDYFDASINRIAAWVIGTRNVLRAMLFALLEPVEMLRASELEGDYTRRLALLEEFKSLPFGAVWDYYCAQQDVPVGAAWLNDVDRYAKDVLSKRE